jgi:hypothetical protein
MVIEQRADFLADDGIVGRGVLEPAERIGGFAIEGSFE